MTWVDIVAGGSVAITGAEIVRRARAHRYPRCQHVRTRCIHGDEGWARMRVFTFRPWKKPIVHRQACLGCGKALDRGPVCVRFPGQHEHTGPWPVDSSTLRP